MIKTKINECTFLNALGKSAQSIPASRKKPSSVQKIKTTETKPETKPELPEPEKKESIEVPSGWKPKGGTEIELDGKKYKVNDHGFWYFGSKQLPTKSEKNLISTLDLEAYKQEQAKLASTPSVEPKDSTTEKAEPEKDQKFLTDEEKENLLNTNNPIDFISLFDGKLPNYVSNYIINTPISLKEVFTVGALLGLIGVSSAAIIKILARRIKYAKNIKEQIHLMKVQYKTLLCIYYLIAYPNLDEELFNSKIKIKIENTLKEVNDDCASAKDLNEQRYILQQHLSDLMQKIKNKVNQRPAIVTESIKNRWKLLAGIGV